MKKLVLAASAACVLTAVPAFAHAETDWYADVGYTTINVDELDINLGLAHARVGAQFTPNFAAEGELALGVGDDTVDDFGTPVTVEMKSLAAGYVVLNYPVNKHLDVFVRAGYATFKVEASSTLGTASDTGSDSTVGFGAKGWFTEKDGVRLDWTNYGGSDAWSLAYVRKF